MDGSRPKVIFSAEDLTAGLVGYSTMGLDGYESGSAFDLARNIVMYAASPRAAGQTTTAPAGK